MLLQTTLCLAAAAAVITLWLAVRTIMVRVQTRTVHGDGGHALLGQRMRAQSNFVEHAPFVLILVGLIEMTGKGGTWLAIAGSVFMLARVAHAIGMDRAQANIWRAIGFSVNLLVLVGLAVVAVLIALGLF